MAKRVGLFTIGLVVTLMSTGCLAPTREATLQSRLDEILDRRADSGATYTARVIELDSGEELYAKDIDAPYIPASNMKLLASVAGLNELGARHDFKTYLAVDGDDLWVIGTGDPGIGDPRLAKKAGGVPTSVFDEWTAALKARGHTHFEGDLYYYEGALDDEWTHPSWGAGVLYWYGAPVSGLNFNDNCIDITIYPTEPGEPVRYEIMPPVEGLQIINECVTGDTTDASIRKLTGGEIYEITGTCSEKTELTSKPVERPGAFFCDALRTHLKNNGVTIAGRTRKFSAPLDGEIPPPAAKIVAVHETPMTDVLNRVNVNSQNFFAEALIKLAGKRYAAREGRQVPGNWRDGEAAVREFLRRYGIDDAQLVVADGSGVSRLNKVTSRMISDLLVVMHGRPDAAVFKDSLSVGGVAGTLRNRFDDNAGRVKAKTGFIGGVRCLSGYVLTDGGEWLVFSILYNNIPGSVKPFEALQDEAVRLLMKWPDIPAE